VIHRVVLATRYPVFLFSAFTATNDRMGNVFRSQGHRRTEARLKSRVQAYNVVHMFCPFDEYQYWIFAVIAVIVLLIVVVLVYCRYIRDYDAVTCQHDDECEPDYGKLEEAVGGEQNEMPQRSPK
jgi:hypothetical protein